MPVNLWQKLPSVGELMENPQLKRWRAALSHNVVVTRVRGMLEELRGEIQTATADLRLPTPAELAQRVARMLAQSDDPRLRPIVNARGVLLPDDMGRAPLADDAIAELTAVARDYASMEIDLASGEHSPRMAAVEGLLQELTGAEAALVVNNDAAAMWLALTALSSGREVVVTRGELIEVDGGYRLPEIIAASGARIREVGATNKTSLGDYRQAINDQTGALLSVHAAPFVARPLSEPPGLAELAGLAHEFRKPLIRDMGAGGLIDLSKFGLPDVPAAAAALQAGTDVVLCSGDKLLGGPPCGIILGRREPLAQIGRHPMARAVRADKLTLAALAGTLRLYRDPAAARRDVPLLSLLDTPTENLKNRAERLAPQLAACPAVASAEAEACSSQLLAGAVSLPSLPSWCVALRPRHADAARLARELMRGVPAILGRVEGERLVFDLRTVFPRQDESLIEAVSALSE